MATPLSRGADFGVLVKCATVTFADTAQTDLFDLPADAYILDIKVHVTTAFAGGTTTLDVGKTGDDNYFLDALSVAATGDATGPTALKNLLTGGISQGTRPIAVTANAGAGNSAGSALIMVAYITLSHAHLH